MKSATLVSNRSAMISAIVAEVNRDPRNILLQFSRKPDEEISKKDQEEMIAEASNPDNWDGCFDDDDDDDCGEDYEPITREEGVEYTFNCEPFDDQLRAYVLHTGSEIKVREIVGE